MAHPLVDLARRFTVDWLDRADPELPARIMAPGYAIHIGGVDMAGVEDYTTATLGQLHRFPGLTLTVHDLITDGERLALVFTEHGASVRDDLRPAAWSGVALFRWDGERLTENWTEEDYYARRRQLADGIPDVVAAPAVAPWTTAPQPGSADTLAVAHAWLGAPAFDCVRIDDDLGAAPAVEVTGVEVIESFSAGDQAAFSAVWTGRYLGGLAGLPEAGASVALRVAGVVTVSDGDVIDGRVVTDRLGLRKSLLPPR